MLISNASDEDNEDDNKYNDVLILLMVLMVIDINEINSHNEFVLRTDPPDGLFQLEDSSNKYLQDLEESQKNKENLNIQMKSLAQGDSVASIISW